ncbi:MAG: mechanosensitive ion channel domain-containing protein [Candidatus Gracilibacteria bacterium]|jgi:small conductance mechanosensitive channel
MANSVAPTVNIDGSVTSSSGNLNFDTLVPQILWKFIDVLEGAAIIALGVFLIRYMHKYFQKVETTHEDQRTAVNLLEKITSGFILVITVTIALKLVGIDMTLLVSVAILGLSYGLQDIIKNYVAGILILFKSPFKIGETVKIREHTGKIHKIDFQSTTLKTFDNKLITIYNSDVMTQSIVNFSNNTMRRIDFDVLLGYGTDIPKALKIFETILQNDTKILKNPGYSVIFKKFTDTACIFNVKFWVQTPCNILKIRSEIALQISQSFDEQKVYMPYEKTIQTETDYTLTDERKKRNEGFYQSSMFSTPEVTQPQLEVQFEDADEPE